MGKEKQKILVVVGSKKFFGSVIRKEKSYFSLDEFYKAWNDWFSEHKYFVNEKGITEKVGAKEIPEMKIIWEARKKVTDYVRFHIDIVLWVRRLRNVRIKGKSERVQLGDLHIGFKAYIEKDYKGKWQNHEFLRRMHDRFLLKDRLLKFEGKLVVETNNLIGLTKKHCGMMPLKK